MPRETTQDQAVLGKAKVKFVKVPARKARLLADLIRGKSVTEALQILKFSKRPSANKILQQLVKNAVNSVDKREHRDTDALVIRKIAVDDGPIEKRWRPRAMGRASRIKKRSSHITLHLTE